jgi:hypothetical protein
MGYALSLYMPVITIPTTTSLSCLIVLKSAVCSMLT